MWCWPVGPSVCCLSVGHNREPCNQSRCRLGFWLRWAQGTVVKVETPSLISLYYADYVHVSKRKVSVWCLSACLCAVSASTTNIHDQSVHRYTETDLPWETVRIMQWLCTIFSLKSLIKEVLPTGSHYAVNVGALIGLESGATVGKVELAMDVSMSMRRAKLYTISACQRTTTLEFKWW